MEIKKSEKANLEHLRGTFILLGLAITLAVLLWAFNYKTYDKSKNEFAQMEQLDDEEDIVITQRDEPPPPPPPPQQQATVLQVVEDDVDVDMDLDIDAEMDEDAEIEDAPVVQEEEEDVQEEEIFMFVEETAEFPGGDAARIKYLRDHIKYPEMAKESNIQGTVYLKFVVEKDGSITHIQVLRGIGGGCDEEAVRVIKNMPKWKPAKQRGRPVRLWFSMPIKFTLQG